MSEDRLSKVDKDTKKEEKKATKVKKTGAKGTSPSDGNQMNRSIANKTRNIAREKKRQETKKVMKVPRGTARQNARHHIQQQDQEQQS